MIQTAASNLLLTGPSGVGKSFLLQNVVKQLADLRCRGFISEIIVDSSMRAGWRLQGLNSEGGVLAHTDVDFSHRMGKYGVDFDLFTRTVRDELRLDVPADLFVIDEIGIISSWDPKVEALIEQVLSSTVPVVAIVREKGEGFASRVRLRNDVENRNLSLENRDRLVDEVVEWIRNR